MDPEPTESQSRFEEHMVTLTYTSSARDAKQLAARLREHGIVALANAEPDRVRRGRYGKSYETVYHPLVAVVSPDLERAQAILAAENPPEGTATLEEIEADLLRMDDDVDEPGGSSFLKSIGITERRLAIFAVAALAGTIIAVTLYSALN